MNKTLLFAAVLGIAGTAFGADKQAIEPALAVVSAEVEVAREKASELNKEVVKPVVQEAKEIYNAEVKPVVQKTGSQVVVTEKKVVEQTKTKASELNARRKKWGF